MLTEINMHALTEKKKNWGKKETENIWMSKKEKQKKLWFI